MILLYLSKNVIIFLGEQTAVSLDVVQVILWRDIIESPEFLPKYGRVFAHHIVSRHHVIDDVLPVLIRNQLILIGDER